MVTTDVIRVRRWPTERPLLYLNYALAILLWIIFFRASSQTVTWFAVVVSFMALMNIGFIAQIRGSAIRLGPDQFPDLYRRVEDLARRMELRQTPEVYLMQQDGALNAFATRFLRSHFVVLMSDLLEACDGNESARDMIIGHELGHIRAGHLRWFHAFLLPVAFVPFVGTALSRAREYTCDRYGVMAADDLDGALTGLTVLAAGARHGTLVNREALMRQRHQISGVWMTLGQWLSTHPPLVKRLQALDPELAAGPAPAPIGRWAAAAVIVLFFGGIFGAGWAGLRAIPEWSAALEASQPFLSREAGRAAQLRDSLGEGGLAIRANAEIQRLIDFIEAERAAGRRIPAHAESLYDRWNAANSDPEPIDPYDGYRLGYHLDEESYSIWSSGPDAQPDTDDDVERTVDLDGEEGGSPRLLPGGKS